MKTTEVSKQAIESIVEKKEKDPEVIKNIK